MPQPVLRTPLIADVLSLLKRFRLGRSWQQGSFKHFFKI